LSTRKSAVADALDALRAKRPAGHPDEIVAMLDAVPDLRPALNTASDNELAKIFRAFDLTITYDKPEQRIHLAATVTPELLPDLANASDRPEGRSQINDIAGAGLKHLGRSRNALPLDRRAAQTSQIAPSRISTGNLFSGRAPAVALIAPASGLNAPCGPRTILPVPTS
jgi:hypothetical protein